MKKCIFFLATAILAIGLTACGDSAKKTDNENTAKKEASAMKPAKEDESKKEGKLSNTTVATKKYKFTIKNIEQITGKLNSEQILAIELTFTNHGIAETTPWIASATTFKATQDTDSTLKSLIGAKRNFPEDYKPELVKLGDSQVKSDETVDAIIGFRIKEPGKPVRLIDFNLKDEPETFERIVETKKK